jgi:hypothetical protein
VQAIGDLIGRALEIPAQIAEVLRRRCDRCSATCGGVEPGVVCWMNHAETFQTQLQFLEHQRQSHGAVKGETRSDRAIVVELWPVCRRIGFETKTQAIA